VLPPSPAHEVNRNNGKINKVSHIYRFFILATCQYIIKYKLRIFPKGYTFMPLPCLAVFDVTPVRQGANEAVVADLATQPVHHEVIVRLGAFPDCHVILSAFSH
jgi:hypothetical protein